MRSGVPVSGVPGRAQLRPNAHAYLYPYFAYLVYLAKTREASDGERAMTEALLDFLVEQARAVKDRRGASRTDATPR